MLCKFYKKRRSIDGNKTPTKSQERDGNMMVYKGAHYSARNSRTFYKLIVNRRGTRILHTSFAFRLQGRPQLIYWLPSWALNSTITEEIKELRASFWSLPVIGLHISWCFFLKPRGNCDAPYQTKDEMLVLM